MSEWHTYQLRDIATPGRNNFIDGDWIEAPFIAGEGIRLIQTGNIGIGKFKNKSTKYISEDSFELLHCKEVYPGDALICRLAEPVGRACVVPSSSERNITSVDVTIFRVDETRFSKKFIIQKINTQEFLDKCLEMSAGTTRTRISRTNLGRLEITVPNLAQQHKIAKILTIVDNIIEKTEALIEKYQNIKQGMMHDLFTRGIDTNGQLRPSHHDAPQLYKQTELGWIPKEWDVPKLSEITSKITDGSHFSPVPQEEGWPIGNVKDMGKYDFIYEECTEILKSQFDLLVAQNCSPVKNDVLLSKDGTIGKVLLYKGDKNIVLLSSIAIIRPLAEVSSVYLKFLLESECFDMQLYSMQSGSALKRLVLKDINKLRFPFPKERKEQESISARLMGIENKIRNEEVSLKKQKQVKKGLMQDLLTGKVRVKING